MLPASSISRRLSFGAASLLGLLLAGAHGLQAQDTLPPQQAPAPVVRVRPRPSTPTDAPPDAAPLVRRQPRVQPIDPQALGGGMTTTSPRTVPRNQQFQVTPPVSALNPVPSVPKVTTPRPANNPDAAVSTAERGTVLARMGQPALNKNVIVLDPAHGGADSGSRIGDRTLEKTVTLAFALRLRSLLAARGFTVVLTRDADTSPTGQDLSLDDRAGIANHAGAAACLFLHATGRGDGVHLYTSELAPTEGTMAEQPWLTAQAPWVPASQQLERSVSAALGRSHVALVSSAASVRPMDSLTCPALILEIAPENGVANSVNNAGYQDRVAGAIAGALVFWQNQVQAPGRAAAPATPARPPHRRSKPAAQSEETTP